MPCQSIHSPNRSGVSCALALALLLLLWPGQAQADKVSDLSTQLLSGSSAKDQTKAARLLGKSHDARALKPLVKALKNKHLSVRQAAAYALGGLGDSRALPALQRTTRDSNRDVRKAATESIGIIKHNSSARVTSGSGRISRIRVNGREAPRLTARKPKVHLQIRSTGDESKAKVSKRVRRGRAQSLRQHMLAGIASTNHFTSNTAIAAEFKLPLYNLDLSIVRLDKVVNGPWIELHCEIRVAISNRKGKMVSFLTGGAKTQVPRKTFKPEFEASMRKEALAGAVKGIHADLLRYLVKNTGV